LSALLHDLRELLVLRHEDLPLLRRRARIGDEALDLLRDFFGFESLRRRRASGNLLG
jgi:hypothetical protein